MNKDIIGRINRKSKLNHWVSIGETQTYQIKFSNLKRKTNSNIQRDTKEQSFERLYLKKLKQLKGDQ